MSLGISLAKTFSENIRLRWRVANITMDTDYPTNGWALAASDFKLNGILFVIPCGQEDGYVPAWDQSAGKLKMFFHDYDAGADAPLIECTSGLDDLANKIVTCIVVGY